MTFRQKILAALAFVGLGPLLLIGVLSFSTSRRALDDTIHRLQEEKAESLVTEAARVAADVLADLAASGSYLPFATLSAQESSEVLHIPYRQFPALTLVGLFGPDGTALVAPVVRRPGDPDDGHETMGEGDLEIFASNVPPVDLIARTGGAIGLPYRNAHGAPRVSMGVVASRDPLRLLIAEVSLEGLAARLAGATGVGGQALLLSDARNLIASAPASAMPTAADEDVCAKAGKSGGRASASIAAANGAWLAAAAVAPELGWCAVLTEPAAVALAPANRLRALSLGWGVLVVLLLAVVGVPLARSLTGPISALSQTVQALGRGNYDARVELERRDELGQLASTLNTMAADIRSRDAEIRRWNAELRDRVEERSRELERVQEQLRRGERLTALASLSAGVAHELNNPLTAIVTLLPLIRNDVADRPKVAEAIDVAIGEGERIHTIVRNFCTFVDDERTQGGSIVSLSEIVCQVVDERRSIAREQGVQIELAGVDTSAHMVGQREQVQSALGHIIDNALLAMREGGHLGINLRVSDHRPLELRVVDDGIGITPENLPRVCDPFFTAWPQGRGSGMGLALATKFITACGGSLDIGSTPGRGTTVAIIFPSAEGGAHLV